LHAECAACPLLTGKTMAHRDAHRMIPAYDLQLPTTARGFAFNCWHWFSSFS
jgi:hypothetical protein